MHSGSVCACRSSPLQSTQPKCSVRPLSWTVTCSHTKPNQTIPNSRDPDDMLTQPLWEPGLRYRPMVCATERSGACRLLTVCASIESQQMAPLELPCLLLSPTRVGLSSGDGFKTRVKRLRIVLPWLSSHLLEAQESDRPTWRCGGFSTRSLTTSQGRRSCSRRLQSMFPCSPSSGDPTGVGWGV